MAKKFLRKPQLGLFHSRTFAPYGPPAELRYRWSCAAAATAAQRSATTFGGGPTPLRRSPEISAQAAGLGSRRRSPQRGAAAQAFGRLRLRMAAALRRGWVSLGPPRRWPAALAAAGRRGRAALSRLRLALDCGYYGGPRLAMAYLVPGQQWQRLRPGPDGDLICEYGQVMADGHGTLFEVRRIAHMPTAESYAKGVNYAKASLEVRRGPGGGVWQGCSDPDLHPPLEYGRIPGCQPWLPSITAEKQEALTRVTNFWSGGHRTPGYGGGLAHYSQKLAGAADGLGGLLAGALEHSPFCWESSGFVGVGLTGALLLVGTLGDCDRLWTPGNRPRRTAAPQLFGEDAPALLRSAPGSYRTLLWQLATAGAGHRGGAAAANPGQSPRPWLQPLAFPGACWQLYGEAVDGLWLQSFWRFLAIHDQMPHNPLYEKAAAGKPLVPYYEPSSHLALVLQLPHCGPGGDLPERDYLGRRLVDTPRCYQQLEWLQGHFGLTDAEVLQLLLAEPGYRSQRLQQLYGPEVGWWLVQEMTLQEEQLRERVAGAVGEQPALSVAETRRLPAAERSQLDRWRERRYLAQGRQPPLPGRGDLWYGVSPRQVFSGALLRLQALQLAAESPEAPAALRRLMAQQLPLENSDGSADGDCGGYGHRGISAEPEDGRGWDSDHSDAEGGDGRREGWSYGDRWDSD